MSLKFTAGQLIKMGKFKEAIPIFNNELNAAWGYLVISRVEMFELIGRFSNILLNPSNFDEVQSLGDAMLQLATRIPNYLIQVNKEEFYANIKLNYDTINTDD